MGKTIFRILSSISILGFFMSMQGVPRQKSQKNAKRTVSQQTKKIKAASLNQKKNKKEPKGKNSQQKKIKQAQVPSQFVQFKRLVNRYVKMKDTQRAQSLAQKILKTFNSLPSKYKQEARGYLTKRKLSLEDLKALKIVAKKPKRQPVAGEEKPRESIPTSTYNEKSLLFVMTLGNLEDALQDPDDSFARSSALSYYNKLRKLVRLPVARSFKEINKPMLEERFYKFWKADQQERWGLVGLEGSPPLQWQEYASRVDHFLSKNKQIDASNIENSLFPYNLLRELLGLSTKSTLQADDKKWFKAIFPEILLYYHVEKGQIKEATTAQKKLIEEAVRLLNIREKIYAAQYATGSEATHAQTVTSYPSELTFIALCQTPDIDYRLSALFHELGHVSHNDTKHDHLIKANEAKPKDFSSQPLFKADINDVMRYLQRGIEIVPTLKNTTIGQKLATYLADPKVQKTFNQYGMFWIPPDKPDEYQKTSYSRGQEQRADLFAVKNLLKHDMVSAILTEVDQRLFYSYENPYLIARGLRTHPSDLERALYMLGFLADQGINLPELIYAWENEGVCTSGEENAAQSPSTHIKKLYDTFKSQQSQKK